MSNCMHGSSSAFRFFAEEPEEELEDDDEPFLVSAKQARHVAALQEEVRLCSLACFERLPEASSSP